MKSTLIGLFIFAIFLTVLLTAENGEAIPAFARRYDISCNTCHAPFPKLKPYGDDYAGAGFILQEEEKERDYVTAGDDLLWLNKDFPIAARFDAYAHYEENADVDNDLQSPFGMKLLSGGTLYKNIGYYFYFYMSERGEVAGIEDAYVHFDNVFGSNLDVMVGQFQTSDPLMKRELRLTYEDYVIYKTRVGNSRNNLAYDRGVMLVYGIDQTSTDVIGMVVNGNGRAEAGADHALDFDSYKNVGLRLNQGIGDIGSVGVYYYTGEEVGATWSEFTNEITYYGPDFNVGVGPLELTAQYLIREDSNPLFNNMTTDISTQGIVAELIFAPKLDRSRWYLTALYNNITSDLDDYPEEVENAGASLMAYHTATLSGTYLLSRNLRLLAEYTRDLERELNLFTLGFITAY